MANKLMYSGLKTIEDIEHLQSENKIAQGMKKFALHIKPSLLHLKHATELTHTSSLMCVKNSRHCFCL